MFKQNLARATRSTQTVRGHHKVQPKETLKNIAAQYHTTVEKLRIANKLSYDQETLLPNTVLLIPTETEIIGAAENETEPSPAHIARKKPAKKLGQAHYRVYYGDTLRSISKKFGISIAQLQKWNHLMDGEQVWPGQVLIVREKS